MKDPGERWYLQKRCCITNLTPADLLPDLTLEAGTDHGYWVNTPATLLYLPNESLPEPTTLAPITFPATLLLTRRRQKVTVQTPMSF